MRRDLRPGNQQATAKTLPCGGVKVSMEWKDPLAGSLQEQYSLQDDMLHITSTVAVGVQQQSTTQVYRRSSKSRADLLSDSKKRNSSMEQVLEKQKAKWGDK